jgi:hypothetical protein
MGFTSQDDLINQITVNGKAFHSDNAKNITPAHTAGGWFLLSGLAGTPNATTYPGTDLVWSNVDEFTGDGTSILGIPNGGAVSTATKHLINVGASVLAAAGAPWQAKLVDLQGYYRLSGSNMTGVSGRTLVNSNTITASDSGGDLLLTYTNDFKSGTKVRFVNSGGGLPGNLSAGTDYWLIRQSSTTAKVATSYANYVAATPKVAYSSAGTGTNTLWIQMPRYALGVGCEAFFVSQTAPTGGGPTLSASAYDNTGVATPGTGTRAFQGSLIMNAAANATATRVLHSGNAAGNYGAFMPKQGADTGIERVNSFTWSGGSAYTGSGVGALCIARPICDLSIPVSGMWSERDLVNQLPSMPRIYDGACLAWMLYATGATTNLSPFTSTLDFAWGSG